MDMHAQNRLMASSQQLLEALQDLLRFAEPLGTITKQDGGEIALPCIVQARAAIAEATRGAA
jgi:hypothetical protein